MLTKIRGIGATPAATRRPPSKRRGYRRRPLAQTRKTRPVNLALQGGGAHGAFTWGVLDRLLEDGNLHFDGISGASAGALNAVVVANGLLDGGPEAAREQLENFWRQVSTKTVFTPYRSTFLDRFLNGWNLDGTSRLAGLDIISRFVSPHQFNPLDLNPLRDILEHGVDFERLRRNRRLKLFIAATNISTGQARIFRTKEITADAVLASAALPSMHHAVEIDGVCFWDGGLSANPPLIPLIEHCPSDDILLVQIDSALDEALPVTASEIRSRMTRLTFLAPLNQELETIAQMRKLAGRGRATPLAKRVRATRLHRIDTGEELRALGQSSKLNPEWGLLRHVRDVGRAQTDRWLEGNIHSIGKSETFNLGADKLSAAD